MNIEICKKCPNYPYYFTGNIFHESSIGLIGHKKDEEYYKISCFIFLSTESIKKISSKNEIDAFEEYKNIDEVLSIEHNSKCPYLFEHEIIDSD